MPVQIVILSGARQGEQLELDDKEFQVGDTHDCAVFFDPDRDQPIRNRRALLRLEEDGWRIRSVGAAPLWLNQHAVQGSMPIRSGDVVRMSPTGPDFSFTIAPRRARPEAAVPELPAAHPAEPARVGHASSRTTTPASFQRRDRAAPVSQFAMGLAAVAAALLLIVGFRFFVSGRRDQSDSTDLTAPTASDHAKPAQNPEPAPGGFGTDTSPAPPEAPVPKPGQPDGQWQTLVERQRAAVLTLAAEEPKGLSMWPIGTGAAIRPDTVVTAASVATELQRLHGDGWKIWALGPDKLQQEIDAVRVHVGYVKATKPEDQLFFDLALVTLKGNLQRVCEVAAADELSAIEERLPFGCLGNVLGTDEEPEPISRFDPLVPELSHGRVLRVQSLSGEPHAPRLLLLPRSTPSGLWGSPIFNEQGKLIAVYTEAAQRTTGGTERLHCAPVITAVADWLLGRGTDLWVPPASPTAPQQQPKQ